MKRLMKRKIQKFQTDKKFLHKFINMFSTLLTYNTNLTKNKSNLTNPFSLASIRAEISKNFLTKLAVVSNDNYFFYKNILVNDLMKSSLDKSFN